MSSFKLLTVRGIPIRIHVTFPLILILVAYQGGRGQAGNWLQGAILGVVFILLLFVCVVLHELAHSLVAMQFGTEVKEIVLLPLGGMARMERIPERPYQELLMAIAGPIASGLIGVILGVATLFFVPHSLRRMIEEAIVGTGDLRWAYVLPALAGANLFLAGFNLIPAFPMDGGRVLRALLATIMPYGRATAIAVTVGQGLAWLIGLYGLLQFDIVAILVAILVYVGAGQEGRMVQVKVALAGLRVRQVFSRHARSISPTAPLGQAVDMTLEGFQADFPVCDEQRLVGMLTRSDVLVGLKEHGPQVPVEAVMRREFLVVGPDDDLFDVQQKMGQARVGAVPVVGGECFLGLLTRQDLEEAYGLVSVRPGILARKQ